MSRRITRTELCQLLELEEAFLARLEHERILGPPDPEGCYDERAVETVRVCWTMVHSLGVNLPGLEVALTLLERLDAERRQVREMAERLRERRG